jgi:hypothetical protein
MEWAYLGHPDSESGEFYVQSIRHEIPYNFVIDAVFDPQHDHLRKKFWHRFLESANLTATRFPLVFLVIPTHQSVKQEHCALLQLLVG